MMKLIGKFLTFLTLVLYFWVSVHGQEAAVMKVAVMKSGEIFADGSRLDLARLKAAFTKLAAERGSVIYYREDPSAADPHPNAMAVIQAIVEARLPVSLSTKPDFSTVVLPDGTVKPRG
jgi:hypothetical protein